MRIPHLALGLKYSPLFVGLVSLSITALAINTTRLRNKLNIWAGDGGNDALRRAARAHGNAVEHGILAIDPKLWRWPCLLQRGGALAVGGHQRAARDLSLHSISFCIVSSVRWTPAWASTSFARG